MRVSVRTPGALLLSRERVVQAVDAGERVELVKEVLRAPLPGGGALGVIRKHTGSPGTAVLLLHGFGQNRYNFHLSTRSFPNYLAARGFDVFNAELRGAGRSFALGAPLPRSFDEHVDLDLPALADLLEACGHARFVLLGHSLGGSVAYAAAPRLARRLSGVATVVGLFRFGAATASLRRLTGWLSGWPTLDRLPLAGRAPLRLDLFGRLQARLWRAFDDPRFPLPARNWFPGSMEPDVLRERLRRGMDRTSGAVLGAVFRFGSTGRFESARGDRDYEDAWARCGLPSLVVGATEDQLTACEEDVRPAFERCTSVERTFVPVGRARDGVAMGHIDSMQGRAAPRVVWPLLADFIGGRA